MGKEYEIELYTGQKDEPVKLATDTRRLARSMKQLAAENGMLCNVERTAKRSVKFAGLDDTTTTE